MSAFEESEHRSDELHTCPDCGADENAAECVCAHPWQHLATLSDVPGSFEIIAEGEDLEMRCACGRIYWVPS